MTETNDPAEEPVKAPVEEGLRRVRRFRTKVIAYSAILTTIAAVAAYPFNPVISHGVVLGGLAGLAGFWLMARSVGKFASIAPSRVKFSVYTGTFTRVLLYALAIGRAYTLDREDMVGVLSALGGIFTVRWIILVLGITSLGRRRD